MPFGVFELGRALMAFGMAWYGFQKLQTPSRWMFLDNVNLIFHEAGHPIFGFFGEFMMFLGGSLMQLLVPLVVTVYFWRSGQRFAACVTTFWLATSLVNLELYIGDATSMELPLLGGDNSTHDWNWLLSTLGWLRFDKTIAGLVYSMGLLSAVLGVVGAAYFVRGDGDAQATPWASETNFKQTSTPIAKLQNLGPRSASMLQTIGIHNRADLELVGPVEAYKRLRLKGQDPGHAFALALQGAINHSPWENLPKSLRSNLVKRLNEVDDQLETQGIPRPRRVPLEDA